MASVTQTQVANKVKRAAIYPRVSSAGQEQDGTSLGTQEQRCREYAAEHGYSVDEAHVYPEVHTGTELWERPQMTRLREAIRAREVDIIIVYALDRLSRNQNHVGVLVDEFDRYGVRLELVTEDFENSVVGKFIRSAKAFASELESEKIRERTIRGKRARLQSGRLLPGWKQPYGYVWHDEGHAALDVDPATAPIVQRIFREAAEGRGIVRIAEGLTLDGIPRPTDRCREPRWSISTIAHILGQSSYTGQVSGWRRNTKASGRRYHDATDQVDLPASVMPPLVDRALFDTVRQRMALNRERATRNNRAPDESLLRGGFVRCGLCGDGLHVVRDQGRNRQTSYRCQRGGHYKGECRQHGIYAHILDPIVWGHILHTLNNPEIIAAQFARFVDNDPSSADLEAIDRTLDGVKRQQTNLVDQLANLSGAVSGLVLEKLNTLEKQRNQLVNERKAVEQRHATWTAARDHLRQLQQWCESAATEIENATYEKKRQWLESLGVEVKVFPQGSANRWVMTASLPQSDDILHIASSTSRATRRSITWTRAEPTA